MLEVFRRGSNNWQTFLGSNVTVVVADDGEFLIIPSDFPPAGESVRQVPMCLNGAVTRTSITVDGNTLGMNVTFTLRVNAVDVVPAVILTITAGVAAIFSAVGNTPIVIDDLVNWRADFVDPVEAGVFVSRNQCCAGRAT